MAENKFSNPQVAKLLRSVAAALNLNKESIFQVRAYETAADAIEHSTSSVKDLWEEGKLGDIPGVGKNLQLYLGEYFKEGKVSHFESIMKKYDPFLFELLDIPGVGPKTALQLSQLSLKSFNDLKAKIESGELEKIGLSEKAGQNILKGLEELTGRSKDRMLLPFAGAQADKILEYLKKGPGVKAADPLGSLRRKVVTIGDLDFAVATTKPEEFIEYFVNMPGVSQVTDKGEFKAVVVLSTGLHVDLLIGPPESYGALLQHFTGSKHHNIRLRTFALKKGLSLNEFGVTTVKTNKLVPTKTEDELYKLLNMDTPEPEMREDAGEIEVALAHKTPKLVQPDDIRGDLHLHSNFPMIHPSHGQGVNEIEEIIKKAISMGYEYVGISDHPPGFRTVSEEEMIKTLESRSKLIEQLKSSHHNIRVLNGLEIDILPDGTLSVPNKILESLDYCIAGIHSSHRSEKEKMTNRILKALENPYVDIISHPTGRILNERDSFDADWDKVFEFCAKNNKLLEINAFPNRLDLRDDLVRQALKVGAKFVIDSDAHEISQMDNMKYGVSVAKRGWVTSEDVVNTWEWKKFAKWFNIL